MTIQVGRFQDRLADLEPASVDLFLTDPPYNLGFDYGEVSDRQKPEDYRAMMADFGRLTFRAAKEGASCFIIHYPEAIAAHWSELTAEWQLRQWLTWVYPSHNPTPGGKFRRASRAVLWLTKGQPKKAETRAVGQVFRNQHDRRVRAHMKANGLNGDQAVPWDWWELEQVKAGSKAHQGYSNQIPDRLLKRPILTTTEPGDLVADPFSGTGSTARTALALGRRAWGCDANPEAARFWKDLDTRQQVFAIEAGRDD